MAKKFAKKIGKIFSFMKSKESKTKAKPRPRRKMVIVGDGECGKTCLVTRMCTGTFVDIGYVPTVFETDVVSVDLGREEVDLTIYDTAGQEDYDRLRPFSYHDVDVAIVCFNLADTDTLTNVAEKWSPEVRNYCGNIPIILVGNKKDLRDPPDLVCSETGAFSTVCDGNDDDNDNNNNNNNNEDVDTQQTSATVDKDGGEADVDDDDENNDNELCEHSDKICNKTSCSSCNSHNVGNRMSRLLEKPVSTARIPFHVQAPVKHSEATLVANRIGAVAYFETSALYGDNVEELLLATAKSSVLGPKKSKTFKPFLGTLKSWKSVKGLEILSRQVV